MYTPQQQTKIQNGVNPTYSSFSFLLPIYIYIPLPFSQILIHLHMQAQTKITTIIHPLIFHLITSQIKFCKNTGKKAPQKLFHHSFHIISQNITSALVVIQVTIMAFELMDYPVTLLVIE